MRVNLQMERASVLYIAINRFSFASYGGSLNKLPFASLVVGNESLN